MGPINSKRSLAQVMIGMKPALFEPMMTKFYDILLLNPSELKKKMSRDLIVNNYHSQMSLIPWNIVCGKSFLKQVNGTGIFAVFLGIKPL